MPVELPKPPHIEVDPSLRTITRGVPIHEAIATPVPEVHTTAEDRLSNFDLRRVTHVVIQQVPSPHPISPKHNANLTAESPSSSRHTSSDPSATSMTGGIRAPSGTSSGGWLPRAARESTAGPLRPFQNDQSTRNCCCRWPNQCHGCCLLQKWHPGRSVEECQLGTQTWCLLPHQPQHTHSSPD